MSGEGKGEDGDRPLCNACSGPITDDTHIAALDTFFHKRCFVCDRCKNAFEGGVFFEHEGRPFCKRHHLELFCAPCNKCKGPVEVGVTLEGRTYHTEHFVCDDCGVSLVDQEEVQLPDDGSIYCTEHFRLRFAPKCPACQTPLEGSVIQALGQSFHSSCFQCAECRKQLDKYCEKDNQAYCAECFTEKFTPKSKCNACSKPIDHGQKMAVFDLFWHKDCLKCTVCDMPFTGDDTMFNVDSRLFCEPHYIATLDRCHRCVEPITGEFLGVSDHKFHGDCLSCIICEAKLNPDLLWKRELGGAPELVCEDHSRGPLTQTVLDRIVSDRTERLRKRAEAEAATKGIHNGDKMAGVYVRGSSAAAAGAGAGAGAGEAEVSQEF